MPVFLALVPRSVWLGLAAALAAGAVALWLMHHGAEQQRATDAAANAKATIHEMEVRRDTDRAADSEPDPSKRLRDEWSR